MRKISAIAVLIFIQSCNTATNKAVHENENKLVGSWKFVADQLLDSTNSIIKQDTAVSGLLIYTTEGKMSVQFLWKDPRASIINDSIMKQDGLSTGLGLGFNTWNAEQTRKLIDTYDAYFGDYSIDWKKNIVTHTITGNLRPEKERTTYQRFFQLKGGSLFLRSADPLSRWQVTCIRNKK
jgi:Lipocalin-like domain